MSKWVVLTIILFLCLEIFSIRPSKLPPAKASSTYPHVYSGITHVHSTYSDGGGTVEEIASAAKDAGFDFVLLTDHNDTRSRRDGKEKNISGLDVFVEMETSAIPGHTIMFFSQTDAAKKDDLAATFVTDDRLFGRPVPPGVFTIVAHPSNIKMPWKGGDNIPDGLEIFNLDSVWQRNGVEHPLSFLVSLATYPLNPFFFHTRVLEAYTPDIKLWDKLNNSGKRFAVVGHDTHSLVKPFEWLSFRFPSYLSNFRLASNVFFLKSALPSDFEKRKTAVYEAIRNGRGAILFQSYYPLGESYWKIECGNKNFVSGDVISLSKEKNCKSKIHMDLNIPYESRGVLLKNGKKVSEISGPGVYRVEVYIKVRSLFGVLLNKEIPYLFYNPIVVQ